MEAAHEGRPTPSLLIVDDDLNLLRLIRTLFRAEGYEAYAVSSGEDALHALSDKSFDAIILDLRMPGMDGRTLFRELRSRGIMTPILIASAHGAREARMDLGAQAAIEKPFEPARLLQAVASLVR